MNGPPPTSGAVASHAGAASWVDACSVVLPKAGHTAGECEDAVAVRVAEDEIRLAVADGATEAAFSQTWARALVEASVTPGVMLEGALEAARQAVGRRIGARGRMPWYAAQKAEAGAFAALLVLHVDASGAWQAEAVGDVTLLHLRDGERVEAWPLADAGAFGNRPDLLASRADLPEPRRLQRRGRWRPGDVLLVATDALAAFLLATPSEAGAFASAEPTAFPTMIDAARAAGMKNDDVALVRLVFDPEAELEAR